MCVTVPDRSRRHETGGIAPAGATPSTLPWPRHTARRLRACSPNRSGNSGTPRAAAGRSKTYIREAPPLRSIAAEKEALHFPFELRHGSVDRFAARIDDYGPLGTQPVEMQPHRLADAAPYTVAHHGFTDGARDGKPDARTRRLGLADAEGRKQRARITAAVVIDPSEICRSQQADTFRKTRDGALPLGTDSEFLPAPCPAAGKHRAAILGLHAGAESVRLGAVAVIRLKGTFRHFSSSIQYRSAERGGAMTATWTGARQIRGWKLRCLFFGLII